MIILIRLISYLKNDSRNLIILNKLVLQFIRTDNFIFIKSIKVFLPPYEIDKNTQPTI